MKNSNISILVTGANGFIGKNLVLRMRELPGISIKTFLRGDNPAFLPKIVESVDAIIHLAGENRPLDPSAFEAVNYGLTSILSDAVECVFRTTGRHIPFLFASSIQASFDNPYGRSKLAAEELLYELADKTSNPCLIYRLPGVFGKWCKPNYNSVVATFCHNIALELPVHVQDHSAILRLVYVDDVVSSILNSLNSCSPGCARIKVEPEYKITLQELAAQIRSFSGCRSGLPIGRVGSGLTRALYSTYLSYLPTHNFSYELTKNDDARGSFVEVIKTFDCGQFSYFTAHPGVTRGGHYHHTKTEKFLVLQGDASFKFRHVISNDLVEIKTSGLSPQVVDTIPGWTHEITNVGTSELIVMLWANEVYDPEKPDTIASSV
jgi:UDP-2-acetamido-2,6-beta-L-arabino-hexul-4-ose reductase